MSQVLVLNASYEPLNITSWRRATVLMLKGKAESLEEDSNHKIRNDIRLPTVIRLRYFVKVPYRELALNKKNLIQRDHNSCQYCGYTGPKLSIDHVIPRSRGGQDVWENVAIACISCNIKKGNRTIQEANMPLRKKPHKPLNSIGLEATKQINSGQHKEWSKYVIG
ncbi:MULTISPECIES: HNH endonuclease [unclassified Prochlorococcus]|uniref:HNH endonuclease n=1 Tax=unclassified Prochlorococcus TaxID=2627481 RepID=UPI0005339B82|nr:MULTISPECIES: HNH endonuclease [unclassified Prochlorococcus]KGG14706.1 HNH endonuclease family protein [Prochlorococcus sp. MIT 0602]KGG15864.1 HNH endonuclease family protein [Prochlorococcus sp. MIT 0603]